MSDKFGDDRDPYPIRLNVMRNCHPSCLMNSPPARTRPRARLPHLCAIHRHLYQDILTGQK
jgi:cell filamentation protein